MPHVLVQPSDIVEDEFQIRGAEAHHLIHVLRVKANEEINLFDGKGRSFRGQITRVLPQEPLASGRILYDLPSHQRSTQIHLYQGLPRGTKFDYVLEKATELGVDAVIPFLSEKNPIRLKEEKEVSKLSRWQKVVEAASKQCGRSTVPTVDFPIKLWDLSLQLKRGTTFLLWAGKKVPPIKDVLREKLTESSLVNVVIGPEAGLTDEERTWILNQGGIAVSLGQSVLRTETAGLVALSILNYELGLF